MIKTKQIPSWIKIGAKADYHSIIGGPVTEPGCTIISEPCNFNESGVYVVMLDKKRGIVSIEALSPVIN